MKKLTLIITLLSVWAITNAQENIILDPISLQKNELKVTPKIEEMLVYSLNRDLTNLSDELLLHWGITNRSQFENLHFGITIPEYRIDFENEKLIFLDSWEVPVMLNGESLFTISVGESKYDGQYYPWRYSGTPALTQNTHNYEHKKMIIGSLRVFYPPDKLRYCLIIKKEHQVLFVEVNDETTGEYIENEYSFSELINHTKERAAKAKEARNRYYAQVANKSELKITQEITEMVVTDVYSSLIDVDEENLPNYGVKNKAQLEHLHLENPIPVYMINIENDSLRFIGSWKVPVMSDGEPLFCARVHLEEDGQYSKGGWDDAGLAINIPNYNHKDLIIGLLEYTRMGYLMIRKDNQDIFVEVYDYATREYFKNEYTFSELINLLKKKK